MKIKFDIRREFKVAAILLGLTALVAFSDRKLKDNTCHDIVVELDNDRENHFIDERDVLRMVEAYPKPLRAQSFTNINLKEIELKLKTHKNFKKVELYNDLKGNMVVHVSLRRPMARLVQEFGPDAYLSEEGLVMPTSERYSSRVIIVSGPYVRQALLEQDLEKSDYGKQLLELLRFIQDDKFWSSQIAEVEVLQSGKILLYPQVTRQIVEFGKPEKIEERFLKLKVFYKKILPKQGWNKYKRVNLEYESQVVAEQ